MIEEKGQPCWWPFFPADLEQRGPLSGGISVFYSLRDKICLEDIKDGSAGST